MRRLIAQAAGRTIHDRIRDAGERELEGLVKAAAAGEIGIAEAAERALQDHSLMTSPTACAAARPAARPEKMQPPRNVPSSAA